MTQGRLKVYESAQWKYVGYGTSGYSGFSGFSGYSGFSGFSGYSGYSGYSGQSGTSGYSAQTPGASGYSGAGGTINVFSTNTISSSPTTLTAAQTNAYVHYITTTAVTTINIPDVTTCTTGALFTIYAKTAYVVTIDPYSTDRIILNGNAQSDGVTVYSAGSAGDYISFHNDSSAGWTVLGRSGLWTIGT